MIDDKDRSEKSPHTEQQNAEAADPAAAVANTGLLASARRKWWAGSEIGFVGPMSF
jgi:hypothetical protein